MLNKEFFVVPVPVHRGRKHYYCFIYVLLTCLEGNQLKIGRLQVRTITAFITNLNFKDTFESLKVTGGTLESLEETFQESTVTDNDRQFTAIS